MIELSALGEDNPSWREWLSTHLMPHLMVVQLPDGQVGLQQRVLPESLPAPTGISDKVSYIGKNWEVETMNNWELALIANSRGQLTVVSWGSLLLWITNTEICIPSYDQQEIWFPCITNKTSIVCWRLGVSFDNASSAIAWMIYLHKPVLNSWALCHLIK